MHSGFKHGRGELVGVSLSSIESTLTLSNQDMQPRSGMVRSSATSNTHAKRVTCFRHDSRHSKQRAASARHLLRGRAPLEASWRRRLDLRILLRLLGLWSLLLRLRVVLRARRRKARMGLRWRERAAGTSQAQPSWESYPHVPPDKLQAPAQPSSACSGAGARQRRRGALCGQRVQGEAV